LRLFVGVSIGDEARRQLAAWAQRAVGRDPALRLVAEERLHLTLAFLGSCDEGLVEPLGAIVGGVVAEAGPLRSGGALWLAPRRPHVLTVAVEGPLEALHDAVWSGLEPVGFARERRRFRPHVTVARVRRGAAPATLELPPPPRVDLGPLALVLYESRLGRDARYEPLVTVPLH